MTAKALGCNWNDCSEYMDIGFILIVSILVLGGVIATAGDRIGTRVGKARLSLFKLRPRQTAVLVTIVTGLTISGSTLAILFSTSKPLRTGVFQLDEIQKKLRTAHRELEETINQKKQTEAQKKQIESELAKTAAQKKQTESELAKTAAQKKQTESELAKTKAEKTDAQKRLDATNASLQAAIAKQSQTAQQASALRLEIKASLVERKKLIDQRNQVKAEITRLEAENEQWKAQSNQLKDKITERDHEIAQQDEVIAQGETRLKEREKQLKQAIAQRQTRLDELEQQLQGREKQLTFLQQEMATLEQYYQYYQVLRQGNVALLRGQVLASGVVRIIDPRATSQAVDQLLSEAHRTAIKATRLASSKVDEPVIQITPQEVEQLIDQIKDGRDYVVRILSAGNYVIGEQHVQVLADAMLNQLVFSAGEVVATTSAADPSKMSEEEIRQQLEQLIAASQFRARRAGIVGDQIQIGDGRITTLISFIEQLKQYNKPVDLRAVVEEDAYTAGPLKMNLIAVSDGQVISST